MRYAHAATDDGTGPLDRRSLAPKGSLRLAALMFQRNGVVKRREAAGIVFGGDDWEKLQRRIREACQPFYELDLIKLVDDTLYGVDMVGLAGWLADEMERREDLGLTDSAVPPPRSAAA